MKHKHHQHSHARNTHSLSKTVALAMAVALMLPVASGWQTVSGSVRDFVGSLVSAEIVAK